MTAQVNIDQLPENMRSKIRMDLCDVPGLHPFCWTWKPARASRRGYGAVSHKGSTRPTHRLVYELLIGSVRPGLHLDHLCRHTACCNPEHLEPVTIQVNVQRGLAAKIADYVKSLETVNGVSMIKPDHIKSQEACHILRVHGTTLARWASEGVLPSVKLPGKHGAFVYNRADVEILCRRTRSSTTRKRVMTDEPDPLFIRVTYPMLMGILFGALLGMTCYGAWFFGSAAAVGIGRWLT